MSAELVGEHWLLASNWPLGSVLRVAFSQHLYGRVVFSKHLCGKREVKSEVKAGSLRRDG